ncbi:MAG: hypothetical protein JF625_27830 [Inquilinus limosus]|uniref:Uncharacterized protein n=1 Tax=Inquilinus limosus TaxID=171674 RepID=A0A952FV38_9PROT|nr:hypothetical protein [Inquilinus limosus]
MTLEPDDHGHLSTRGPGGRRSGMLLPMLLPILLAATAAGCAPKTEPPPAAPQGTAQKDRMAELLQVPIPQGWVLASRSATPEMILSEYVPAGQTADQWADMITVMTIDRRTAPSLAVLAQRLDQRFRSGAGCAVTPIVESPTVRSDDPYPYAVQAVLCGRTERWGKGEYMAHRVIEGRDAYYDVQRSRRLPPATASAELPVTAEMRDEAIALLSAVGVCDNRLPDRRC